MGFDFQIVREWISARGFRTCVTVVAGAAAATIIWRHREPPVYLDGIDEITISAAWIERMLAVGADAEDVNAIDIVTTKLYEPGSYSFNRFIVTNTTWIAAVTNAVGVYPFRPDLAMNKGTDATLHGLTGNALYRSLYFDFVGSGPMRWMDDTAWDPVGMTPGQMAALDITSKWWVREIGTNLWTQYGLTPLAWAADGSDASQCFLPFFYEDEPPDPNDLIPDHLSDYYFSTNALNQVAAVLSRLRVLRCIAEPYYPLVSTCRVWRAVGESWVTTNEMDAVASLSEFLYLVGSKIISAADACAASGLENVVVAGTPYSDLLSIDQIASTNDLYAFGFRAVEIYPQFGMTVAPVCTNFQATARFYYGAAALPNVGDVFQNQYGTASNTFSYASAEFDLGPAVFREAEGEWHLSIDNIRTSEPPRLTLPIYGLEERILEFVHPSLFYIQSFNYDIGWTGAIYPFCIIQFDFDHLADPSIFWGDP